MTTDKMFVLLLVMLLPLTGCLDISDNAEAEDSEDETTIVNNYYNNTTTVEPEMVHLYVYKEATNFVARITIDENQTIEWLSSQSIVNVSGSEAYRSNIVQVINVSCIDSAAVYYGLAGEGFAIKGEGECTYTLAINYGNNLVDAHHSLVYLIHEL